MSTTETQNKKPTTRTKELAGDAGRIKDLFYKFKKLASKRLDANGNLVGFNFVPKDAEDKVEYLKVTRTIKGKDGAADETKVLEGVDAVQDEMSRRYAIFGGRIEKYGTDEKHAIAKSTIKKFVQDSIKDGKTPDLGFQKENAQTLLDALMSIYEPTGERKKSVGSNLEAVSFDDLMFE